MGDMKCVNEIIIDFDMETAVLLGRILNNAITRSIESGLPVDQKCYPSIEKLKTLSELSGIVTIKLPNTIQIDEDYMAYKGIKEAKEV